MRRSVVSAMLGALLTLAAAAPATAIAGQGNLIHVDDDALIGGNGSSRFPWLLGIRSLQATCAPW